MILAPLNDKVKVNVYIYCIHLYNLSFYIIIGYAVIQLPEMLIGFFAWSKEKSFGNVSITSNSNDMQDSCPIEKKNISKHQSTVIQLRSTINNVELPEMNIENMHDQKKVINTLFRGLNAICERQDNMELTLRNISLEMKNLRLSLTK